MSATLLPQHAAHLEPFRIPPELLEAAGVCSVTDAETRDLLGVNGGHSGENLGGIVFPYRSPLTDARTGVRVRLDHPLAEGGKYLSERGCRHLFFPPGVAGLLSDVSAPVVIVEAEKSALALWALSERAVRPMLPVAVGGCWGWRRKIGNRPLSSGGTEPETGPSPDLDLIYWPWRLAIIMFDSNASTNPDVSAARRALEKDLIERGAEVCIVDVPAAIDGVEINGPDDYIYAAGDEAVLAALKPLILDPGDPLPSARAFISAKYSAGEKRILNHQRDIFYYWCKERNVYDELPEAELRASLYRFLERAKVRMEQKTAKGKPPVLMPFEPTKHKIENVLDALRAEANLPEAFAHPCWLNDDPGLDPADVLPCTNGLLHVPTRKLLPADPSLFALNGIDFAYNADSPKPEKWLKFLKDIWPDPHRDDYKDDDDYDRALAAAEEPHKALQELFGYFLTPHVHFQKIGLIIGPKRAGKGTIAKVLRLLVGERNSCSPTLDALSKQFGLAVLIGKSVAAITDARISKRTDTAVITERLLSISGEDAQSIPRKFKSDWNGKLGVRFFVMTNEVPWIEDSSGALASRFVVLSLTKSFYGREDLKLFDSFKPELPGILLWAIDGWDRLCRQGHFTNPQASAELIEHLEDLGSPVEAFLKDRCETGSGYTVSCSDLYSAWRDWCAASGREKPGTVQALSRNIHAARPYLKISRPRNAEGRQHKAWEGIRLAMKAG